MLTGELLGGFAHLTWWDVTTAVGCGGLLGLLALGTAALRRHGMWTVKSIGIECARWGAALVLIFLYARSGCAPMP